MENKKMDESQKMEIEISKIVVDTYNKVALWNNNDYDSTRQKSDALKIVCQDIVQNVLEGLMHGLNVQTNTEVTRGDVKIGDTQIVKDKDSFDKVNEKDVFDKLFINKSNQQ